MKPLVLTLLLQNFIFFTHLIGQCESLDLNPVVVEGQVGVLYQDFTSSDREIIFQFKNVSQFFNRGRAAALRIHSASFQSSFNEPITIVARQTKGVFSWQIPLTFPQTSAFIDKYYSINRTICPTVYSDAGNLLDSNYNYDESLFVTVSASSFRNISFNLLVYEQEDFQISFDTTYKVTVSPSTPIFFQLNIPDDVDVGLLRLHSQDDACMMLSIQNFSCPVHDLTTNVEFDGYYQSVHHQAGITFSRAEYPNGLFIVLIVRPDDDLCFGNVYNISNEWPFRDKLVEFSVVEKISQEDYLAATFGAILMFASVYLFTGCICCINVVTGHVRNSSRLTVPVDDENAAVTSGSSETTPLLQTTADVHCDHGPDGDNQSDDLEDEDDGEALVVRSTTRRTRYGSIETNHLHQPLQVQGGYTEVGDQAEDLIIAAQDIVQTQISRSDASSSLDVRDLDFLEDADLEKDIYRTKRQLFVSDLSRKSSRVLVKKAQLYHWNLLTIATFYALPVIQLVLTYQNVANTTGNLDLCYFNFFCAQKLGLVSDFNHVFSNLGYVLLGILFTLIVYRRDVAHRKRHLLDPRCEQCGIPQHFGMYYAMGLGLIIEGVMSGCYHVCPNHTNFQFDTAFMYTISILILLKIYQTRHPDINANAYTAFGVLAFVILVSTIGVLKGNLYFWIFFTSLHVISCFLLSLNIYYMGRWKLNGGIFKRVWHICVNDCRALRGGYWSALKPLYVDRLILLLLLNAANWGLSGYGVFVLGHSGDFASFLLAVFIFNVMLYTLFYILMKLRHRERIKALPAFFITLSTVTWFGAMYFFFNKSTTWNNTPAISRDYNQDCKLLHFYDNHDIWHFLSSASLFFSFMILLTLDDDLADVPRDKIPVF